MYWFCQHQYKSSSFNLENILLLLTINQVAWTIVQRKNYTLNIWTLPFSIKYFNFISFSIENFNSQLSKKKKKPFPIEQFNSWSCFREALQLSESLMVCTALTRRKGCAQKMLQSRILLPFATLALAPTYQGILYHPLFIMVLHSHNMHGYARHVCAHTNNIRILSSVTKTLPPFRHFLLKVASE